MAGGPSEGQIETDERLFMNALAVESRDFTPWLKENIGTLSDAIGVKIETVEREVRVGPFSCDLWAKEVGTDRVVIIENQLEPTDHKHLGQLVLYAAGLDARAVVWVSPKFVEDHRHALEWLNAVTSAEIAFFGVEHRFLERPYRQRAAARAV